MAVTLVSPAQRALQNAYTPTVPSSLSHTANKHNSLAQRYHVVRSNVRSGASGCVDIAIDQITLQAVVLKRVKRTKNNMCELAREEAIHSAATSLQHKNICELIEARHQTTTVVFVLPYYSGGDLLDNIPPDAGLDPRLALYYSLQLFCALDALHFHGYAHRDVKGENCVLTEDKRTLKLIDFGYSSRLDDKEATGRASGTVPYLAPEIFTGKTNDLSKCDVWSAGIVLYSLLTGRFPWSKAVETDSEYSLFLAGTHSPGEEKRWQALPRSVVKILHMLLEHNPAKRLSAKEATRHITAVLGARL